jgi:hypothetical protein
VRKFIFFTETNKEKNQVGVFLKSGIEWRSHLWIINAK